MKLSVLLVTLAGAIVAAAAVPGWAALASDHHPVAITIQVSHSSGQQIKLNYTLPAKGYVTLVINNAQGMRVRNLVGAVPETAGPHTQIWDGTNDDGKAVPAGNYQWKLLFDRGIGLKYVLTYGNPGSPPWTLRGASGWGTIGGKGGWGADHTAPEAIAAAGNSMVLGWPLAENGWYLIGVGLDGRKEWGLKNRLAFGDLNIALAISGGDLYVASEQNPDSLMHYYKKMADLVLFRYSLKNQRIVRFGKHIDIVVSHVLKNNLQGLAIIGHEAYVALRHQNRIAAVSLIRGSLDLARAIPVRDPGALTADNRGNLLAISGNQVLRINPHTRQSTLVVATGLDDPSGICTDGAGEIFVADRGHAQQVKVFSAAGKYLRAIGVAGGRPPIGYTNREGMYMPKGIAVDAMGRLWVMEQDKRPKRTSVWNIHTGKLIKDFIGAPDYGAINGYVAPFDKTLAFGQGVEYRLNWKSKKFHGDYQYVGTTSRSMGPADVFGNNVPIDIIHYHGRVFTTSGNHVEVISEFKNGRLRPLSAIGSLDGQTLRQGMITGALAAAMPKLRASGAKLFYKSQMPIASFIWTDQNGDGIPQASELIWKKNLDWGGYWSNSVDRHLTVFMQARNAVYRLPVTGWNKCGAPIYSFKSAKPIAFSGFCESGMAVTPNGQLLLVNAIPKFQAINVASGKQLWTYPNPWASVHGSHTANVPAPGRLIGPLRITGFAHVGGQVGTLFAMNGNLGQQFLMTTDGLWVAALLHDWRLSHGEGMYSIQDEDFGGYFWRDRASGKVYLEAGKDDYRIFRVTGLNTIRRNQGDFSVTSAEASAATALVATRHRPRRHIHTLTVVHLAKPMKITANLSDVPATMHFTRVVANAANQFQFALGYDQRNMYAVWDVTDPERFVNDGRNWYRMFKSGDCVDLMLGTNPKANPQRTAGVAGDERLLLTLMHNKPLVVLYKQVDPTRSWPAAFVSPSRAVYFGSVSQLHDVAMAIHQTRTGYVVMAKIPLATVGINIAKYKMITGDVGVIYGSPTGGSARLRLYWSNKATAITSDVPSEAALQPNEWGQFKFK